ncbi:GLPGLI family protein [Aurantibacter sp.]|uniref:GLPGLI family protein n=1 Tax=Aurantibacter sp. TaxID=2807103 RepID=UPI0035C7FF27
MKSNLLKLSLLSLLLIFTTSVNRDLEYVSLDDFQAKAYYFSKQKMDLGKWGNQLTEAQKKDVASRLKNRLQKTYVLSFNKEESSFYEEEKIDAISGATDSWGKNFTPGLQYKNLKSKTQIQNQEFYGKRFMVKDSLLKIDWQLSGETKQIGNYTCFRANALIPTNDLNWYAFSWGKLRTAEKKDGTENQIELTQVEAWYTLQIPVATGPLEYSGLPGLILEVSADNTTILCSKIVINPEEEIEIVIPNKGKEVSKQEYQDIVLQKMKEFRSNRMGR